MIEQQIKSTLEQLDQLSRTRPLSQGEVLRLERALRGKLEPKGQKPWTVADKLRLRRHLLNGKKPAQIAIQMRRTERAVWRMMNKLGWTVHEAQVWVVNPTEGL